MWSNFKNKMGKGLALKSKWCGLSLGSAVSYCGDPVALMMVNM